MTIKRLFARVSGAESIFSTASDDLKAVVQSADQARLAGNYDEAIRLYRSGLDKARSTRNDQGAEVFLGLLGSAYVQSGNADSGLSLLQEAMESAAKSGQGYRRARAMVNLGAYYIAREEYSAARKTLESAYELGRTSRDSLAAMLALVNLADVYVAQNNTTYALKLLQESAATFAQNPAQSAMVFGRMAAIYAQTSDYDRARKMYVQAVEFAVTGNVPHLEMQYAGALAGLLSERGDSNEAERYFQRYEGLRAQGIMTGSELPTDLGIRLKLNEAGLALRTGKHDQAITAAQAVLSQTDTPPIARAQAQALNVLAQAYRAKGDNVQAENGYRQAVAAFERIIVTGSDQPEDQAVRTEYIQSLVALGALLQGRADSEANDLFDKALETAGTTDRIGRALALRQIGISLFERRELTEALARYQEALGLLESENAYMYMARLLCDIGAARRQQSGIKAALEDYERATILLSHVKDDTTRGVVLSNAANLYTDLGETATAASFYQTAIQLARDTNNKQAEALRRGNYGWYYLQVGQPIRAQQMIQDALSYTREINDPLMIAIQTNNLAQAMHEQGDYQGALQLLETALQTVESLNRPTWIAVIKSNIGRAKLSLEQLDEAETLLNEALTIARRENEQETVCRTLTRLCALLSRRGMTEPSLYEQAETYGREAETIARKWGYKRGQADALQARSTLAALKGDTSESIRLGDEATRIYTLFRDGMS